jgi:hypothetical protein
MHTKVGTLQLELTVEVTGLADSPRLIDFKLSQHLPERCGFSIVPEVDGLVEKIRETGDFDTYLIPSLKNVIHVKAFWASLFLFSHQ